jgi:hypothetical protein
MHYMLDGIVYRRGVLAFLRFCMASDDSHYDKFMFIDTNDREHSLFPLACLSCNMYQHSQYLLMLL